jgi:hypothetical protein
VKTPPTTPGPENVPPVGLAEVSAARSMAGSVTIRSKRRTGIVIVGSGSTTRITNVVVWRAVAPSAIV